MNFLNLYSKIATTLLCTVCLSSHAQMRSFKSYKVNFSEEIKTTNTIRNILGATEEYIYVESGNQKLEYLTASHIHQIDKQTLEEKRTAPISISYKNRGLTTHGSYMFGGKLIGIGSISNDETSSNYQFIQEFNLETLEPKGDLIRANQYAYTSGNSEEAVITTSFTFDKDYMIIMAKPLSAKQNDLTEIAISVIDTNLNVVWKEQVKLDIPFKFLTLQDIAVDSRGIGYLLVKEKLSKGSDIKKKKANYRYKFFVKAPNKPVVERKLSTESSHVTSASILARKDQLYVTGLYGDLKKGRMYLSGTFIAELNTETFEVEDKRTFDLNEDFFLQGITNQKSYNMSLTNFVLDEIIPLKDGAHIIIYEEKWVSVTTTSRGGAHYSWYRRNLLVSRVSADGEIEWVKLIRKSQRVNKPKRKKLISYASCHDKAFLYLMFNSNIKNQKTKKTYDKGRSKMFTGKKAKKSFAEIVSIDIVHGDETREILFRQKESQTMLVPSGSGMEDGTCFLLSQKNKRKKRYATMKMDVE